MLPSKVDGSTPFKNRLLESPIVIRGDGLGAFPTLTAAIAKYGAAMEYLIEGELTEDLVIPDDLASLHIFGGIGAKLIGDIVADDITGDGADFNLYITDLKIEGHIEFTADDIYMNLWLDHVTIIETTTSIPAIAFDNTGFGNLILYAENGCYLQGHGGGITLAGSGQTYIYLRHSRIYTTTAQGIILGDGASLYGGGYIEHSTIQGQTDAITSTSAVAVSAYLNLLVNGVHANVTLPVGGGNVEI